MWWAVSDEYVGIRRYPVPDLLERLPTVEVEGPVAELGLPRRAIYLEV